MKLWLACFSVCARLQLSSAKEKRKKEGPLVEILLACSKIEQISREKRTGSRRWGSGERETGETEVCRLTGRSETGKTGKGESAPQLSITALQLQLAMPPSHYVPYLDHEISLPGKRVGSKLESFLVLMKVPTSNRIKCQV